MLFFLAYTILKNIWEIVPIFMFLAVIISFLIFIISRFNIKSNKKFRILGSLIPLMFLIILFYPKQYF